MIRRISAIYVRTKSGNDERIRRILAHAANIGGSGVYVTASADLSQARNTADDSLTTLGLMIGVIALIVGGMSIANDDRHGHGTTRRNRLATGTGRCAANR